jgi:hypothetical protein
MGNTQLQAWRELADASDVDTPRVTAKSVEAEGVVTFRLERPDGGRLADWTPGAPMKPEADFSAPRHETTAADPPGAS